MPIEIWWDLLERELKIALEDLEGRSTRSVGRESRWGVSAFHPEFPSGRTERIRNVGHRESPFWRGVFPSFLPRGQEPGGAHHAAWCVSA